MNKKLIIISIILLVMLLATGCAGFEAKPEPYEYTHTTELRQFELYEYEHIRDIDRSVVMNLAQLGYSDLTLAGGDNDKNQPLPLSPGHCRFRHVCY